MATTVDETRVAKTGRCRSATVAAPRPADRWMVGCDDGFTTYRVYDTGYVR